MNLEREREIFIDWHFNKYYAKDADKEFLYEMFEDKNEFVSYEVQHSWVAWLASASRNGYKLVPTQATNKIMVAIESKAGNQLQASGISQDPFRLDGETIYEAMLGAVDET